MSDLTNTVRLHRVLRAPPERVYRAFLDPDAMAKWVPPHEQIRYTELNRSARRRQCSTPR